MKWHGPDMQTVLASLSEGVPAPLSKKRRCQQNFDAVHNYGTATFWATVLEESTPSSGKLNSIMQLAIGVGLRLPSEHNQMVVLVVAYRGRGSG